MAGIRVSKLCRLFNVGPKELIAFLSTKGIMVSSSPNFKVPEPALEFLREKYGCESVESLATTPIADNHDENVFAEVKTLSVESKAEPEKPLVMPDSPFKIGTSGKYKLLIKTVTYCFYHYEYLLSDAEEKEYKTISDALYSEGQLLRCMVNLKGEKGRLVVDSVAICKKQDMATLIKIIKQPEPKFVFEPISKYQSNIKTKKDRKAKVKHKTTQFNQKPKKKRAKRMIHYEKRSGYSQNNYEPTLYKGGAHLIYTPMGNKR